MRSRGALGALAGILVLKALSLSSAEVPSASFNYTNDGFSITLLPGWKELSPEQVGQLRGMDEGSLRVPVQGIVHIYQIETAGKPLEPPFVLVQVAKTGRVSDFVMRRFLGTNDHRDELRQLLRAEGISEGSVRSVSFDTNQFVIRLDAVQENNLSRDRTLTKIFFTEDGAISVAALSTELDFPKWSATFGQIIDSVKIAEGSRYRLRPPPDLSSGSRDWIVMGGGLAAMVFLIGGWIYWTQVRSPSTLEY
jgi:hypothetical protein